MQGRSIMRENVVCIMLHEIDENWKSLEISLLRIITENCLGFLITSDLLSMEKK